MPAPQAHPNSAKIYQGRFAPSPTGPLHMGSMFAALGSYLQAKKQNGKWRVRIDDLDPPREMKGAASSILRTLENFGLEWDENIVYQSQRHDLYEHTLDQLKKQSLIFHCRCSRKDIKATASIGPIGFVYPGTCRDKNITDSNTTVRLKTADLKISFNDLLQGETTQHIAQQIGDVALKRADGFYAYHLAVVADDYEENINEIVRGIDLLGCTPIQIYLQQCLNYPTPRYLHLPILVNQRNEKLSKQTKAKAVNDGADVKIGETLFTLLSQLNQQPPENLKHENKSTILKWGIEHWDVKKIGKTTKIKTG